MLLKKFVDKIYCINLKRRKDRKTKMIKEAKRLSIPITFIDAFDTPDNGAKGCYFSHKKIIELAKKNKYKRVLILEDECEFSVKKLEINTKTLPEDWEMLYLGGNVVDVYEDITDFKMLDKTWASVSCYMNHCYIIGKQSYDIILDQLDRFNGKYKMPIDTFFLKKIHPRKKSYVLLNQIAHQREDYSDIENKNVKYIQKQVTDSFVTIPRLKLITRDGKCFLDIKKTYTEKDLPYISIVTPTKNRKNLFELAINNFLSFDYPHDKLEWVILDDSDNGDDLRDILPNDNRIKYIRINISKTIPIGTKRNLCVKYTTHDYIMQMDDDDYYYPTAIRSMIEVLLDNPTIDLVCCSYICCYSVLTKQYTISGRPSEPSEATMMYKKSFHEEKKYHSRILQGEGIIYITNRKKRVIQIPHEYVIIVINHRKNFTENLRISTDYVEKCYSIPEKTLKLINKIHS